MNEALNYAKAQHQLGNLDLAEQAYITSLNFEPGNIQALCLLALIKKEWGDFQNATLLLQQALSLKPSDVNILLELAIARSALKDFALAKATYEEILAADGDHVQALCNLANIFTHEANFLKAHQLYEKALLIRPNDKTILFNLGTLYLKQLKPKEAIQFLSKAVKIDDQYANAINSLGAALLDHGDRAQAKQNFLRAIHLKKDFPEPLFNLHALLVDESKFSEALSLLSQAHAIDPLNSNYMFFIHMISEYLEQKGLAESICNLNIKTLEDCTADLESWAYIKDQKNQPLLLGTDQKVIEYAIKNATVNGLVLEFGVFNGKSITHIATLINSEVHGFDSFEGIPEQWNDEPVGSYSALGKLPEVPGNVKLHQGWFNQSIPPFLASHSEPIRFINIDCDLYSSTKTIFDLLGERIIPGSIILFDEFIGYKSWKEDEFRAFHEAVEFYKWKYEVICFSFMTKQVAIKITSAQ
jgi:Tfp pilus assembly protein PilF